MKIQNTNVQPQETRPEAARDTKAAAYTGRAARADGKDGGPGGGGATDAVSLSSLSQQVRAASAAQEAGNVEREKRIGELAALVGSGNYNVDPAALSKKIVEDALLGGL